MATSGMPLEFWPRVPKVKTGAHTDTSRVHTRVRDEGSRHSSMPVDPAPWHAKEATNPPRRTVLQMAGRRRTHCC